MAYLGGFVRDEDVPALIGILQERGFSLRISFSPQVLESEGPSEPAVVEAPPPLAARLRSYRERVGSSQKSVAGKLGVTTATVRRWERTGVIPKESSQKAIQKLVGD
jgi:DNA-binding transcriptional regulator YiaG